MRDDSQIIKYDELMLLNTKFLVELKDELKNIEGHPELFATIIKRRIEQGIWKLILVAVVLIMLQLFLVFFAVTLSKPYSFEEYLNICKLLFSLGGSAFGGTLGVIVGWRALFERLKKPSIQ